MSDSQLELSVLEMEALIVGLLKRMGGNATFAELNALSGFASEEGQASYSYELAPNVVIWEGMTAPACEAMVRLRKRRQVDFEPCPVLYYYMDGISLDMPLAKRPTDRGYKKPRWIPVNVVLQKEA